MDMRMRNWKIKLKRIKLIKETNFKLVIKKVLHIKLKIIHVHNAWKYNQNNLYYFVPNVIKNIQKLMLNI